MRARFPLLLPLGLSACAPYLHIHAPQYDGDDLEVSMHLAHQGEGQLDALVLELSNLQEGAAYIDWESASISSPESGAMDLRVLPEHEVSVVEERSVFWIIPEAPLVEYVDTERNLLAPVSRIQEGPVHFTLMVDVCRGPLQGEGRPRICSAGARGWQPRSFQGQLLLAPAHTLP